MSEFIYTLIIVFAIFMVSFLLLNFKFFLKGEEFKKTCSTTGEKCACSDEKSEEKECDNRIITK
ncbi:MAG: hypothetical protein IPH57_16955 [Saprospiraceae bacterium]|nr:hypothetical protein [Saprospiraceae bacterium]